MPKPTGAHGYSKNPHATVSFCDGWFYTGDLGYFDEEGYLFDSGCKKDMLKSGGISIYALEIESVICSHSDILEAAVIGVPDPQWGEALKAVIVLKRRGWRLTKCRSRWSSSSRCHTRNGQGEQGPGTRDDLVSVSYLKEFP